MHAHHDVLAVADVAAHERDVRLAVEPLSKAWIVNGPYSVGSSAVATRVTRLSVRIR